MSNERSKGRPGSIETGQSRIGGMFDTVSARMIAIILLSSIPLAVLSGLVSWHNYENASGYSSARAGSLVEVLRSRAQQDLAQSTTFLQDIAALDELNDPAACNKALHLALLTQAPRYDVLGVMDRSGKVLCTSGGSLPASTLPPQNSASGIRRIGLQRNTDGTPVMIAEILASSPLDPSHFVMGNLRMGWRKGDLFGRHGRIGMLDDELPVRAWLVGSGGETAPLCQDCGWVMPDNLADLRLQAAAGNGRGISVAEGSAALSVLVGPVDVLAITRLTRDEMRALSVFIIRVIAIVLLLGLGLVGVSVGANMLVVAPVQRLTGAVTQWRRAGEYDAGDTRLMPVELRALSHAFTQAARSLAAHETTLSHAEARQELLIKEIHHRVKNNLQIIASLLNLQANRIRQPEAKAEFASARDRVRALATLHRYLYSEGELQTLNMRSFLQELCSQLFQAIGEKQGRRIQLHIEADEIELDTDQAVPLSLVVTEAVSNAVKYAFPGGRSGHVHVILSDLGEGMGRLVIQDDGVGIPAGRAETETGIRDGLGIQLIRGFARQLAAEFDVHEGDGTRYTLTFPLHPQQASADGMDDDAPAHNEAEPASGHSSSGNNPETR